MIKLSVEQLRRNEDEILSIIDLIDIHNVARESFLDYLYATDFFVAPASTKYHACYRGGLAVHTINVYKNLCKLVDMYGFKDIYNQSTIAKMAFHDISKVNYYETKTINVKNYSENGSKSDGGGKFDWVSELAFGVIDAHDRFLSGDHAFNSYMILKDYFNLNQEEITAIINHHCGMDTNGGNRDLSAILNKYPLATLLHIADMLSVYIDERI